MDLNARAGRSEAAWHTYTRNRSLFLALGAFNELPRRATALSLHFPFARFFYWLHPRSACRIFEFNGTCPERLILRNAMNIFRGLGKLNF